MALRLVTLAALLLGTAPAHAGGQYELFGVDPRGKGMAGAQTAATQDASATYYNPAGLAELRAATMFATVTGNHSALYVDPSKPLPPDDWRRPSMPRDFLGLSLGGAVPLGGKFNRITLGVSAYAPGSHALTVRTLDPQQPHFYFYEAQPDRFELLPAASVRVTDFIKLGLGLRMGGGIRGPSEATIDPLQGRATRKQFDGELYYIFAPTAGVLLGPLWGFRLGATMRGPVQVPIDIPNTISGDGVDAQTQLIFRANTNYTPPTASVGISWSGFNDKLTVALDFQYALWSLAPDPSVQYTIDVSGRDLASLGLDETLDSPQPGQERKVKLGFRNILVPRLGFEYRVFDDWLRVRAGSFFRPTPVPDQTSGSNYLDANAWAATGGLAFRPRDPFGFLAKPLSLECSLQVLQVLERRVVKRLDSDPVGNLRFGGQVIEAALGVSYGF